MVRTTRKGGASQVAPSSFQFPEFLDFCSTTSGQLDCNVFPLGTQFLVPRHRDILLVFGPCVQKPSISGHRWSTDESLHYRMRLYNDKSIEHQRLTYNSVHEKLPTPAEDKPADSVMGAPADRKQHWVFF